MIAFVDRRDGEMGVPLRGSLTWKIGIFKKKFENEFFAVKHARYRHASCVKISGR